MSSDLALFDYKTKILPGAQLHIMQVPRRPPSDAVRRVPVTSHEPGKQLEILYQREKTGIFLEKLCSDGSCGRPSSFESAVKAPTFQSKACLASNPVVLYAYCILVPFTSMQYQVETV